MDDVLQRSQSSDVSSLPGYSERNGEQDLKDADWPSTPDRQSSFQDFLNYEVGLRVGQPKERIRSRGPISYKGIDIDLAHSGRDSFRLTPIASADELRVWLAQDLGSRHSKPMPHRMRLLVHFWPENLPSKTPFPFENETVAGEAIRTLGTPRTYLYILARNSYAPFRLQHDGDPGEGHIYCQSPQFANYFTSMALSYSTRRGTISGFLCLESSQSALLFHLQQLKDYIGHPLLLPILIFRQRADFHQTRSQMANNMMDSVQSGTGLLHSSFFFDPDVVKAPSAEIEDDSTTDRLHATIVNSHGHLTHGAMYFLEDLAEGIRRAISRVPCTLSDRELVNLKMLFDITSDEAKIALNHKDTLIARMNVQLQALYNIMQQNSMKQARRDVKITLKDSAQMKAIALMTMIFLPSTALATIFSMSSFFSTDDDGNLKVLPHFWVFWAISLPVTFSVLALYLVWIRWMEKIRG